MNIIYSFLLLFLFIRVGIYITEAFINSYALMMIVDEKLSFSGLVV